MDNQNTEKARERSEAKFINGKRLIKRRKRKARLFYALLVLFVLSVGVVLSLTVFFNIDKIEVVGSTRYETDRIIELSRIKIGENLFLSSMNAGRDDILKEMPYIESVSIQRKMPSRVRITVTEAEEAGYFQKDGENIVVSGLSKVLRKTPDMPEGIPLIECGSVSGTETGQTVVFEDERNEKILNDVSKAIEESGISDITKIEIIDSIKVKMMYQDRIEITIGAPTELHDKLALGKKVLSEKIPPEEKGRLNLTNPRRAPYEAITAQ